jgi:Transposase
VSTTRHTDTVEVVFKDQRRMRWSPADKAALVRRTYGPGMSVSLVARQKGVAASLLFQWRKLNRPDQALPVPFTAGHQRPGPTEHIHPNGGKRGDKAAPSSTRESTTLLFNASTTTPCARKLRNDVTVKLLSMNASVCVAMWV